jgi:hypothetical protein
MKVIRIQPPGPPGGNAAGAPRASGHGPPPEPAKPSDLHPAPPVPILSLIQE